MVRAEDYEMETMELTEGRSIFFIFPSGAGMGLLAYGLHGS